MKRIFISADIEGTCGIISWKETEKGQAEHTAFCASMTQEVRAACEGATNGGAQSILVKDAHGQARNIDPNALPENVCVFRGWGNGIYNMMEGLEDGFAGVFLTGYHSGASMGGNPLAHTMNTGNVSVKINDEICTEMMISAYTASMVRVPLLLVTGDETLCSAVRRLSPNTITVPVSSGVGAGSIAMHPAHAVAAIREAAEQAMRLSSDNCIVPLPETFHIEIYYREHMRARTCGYYPGAKQSGPHTVTFDCTDYLEALRFFHFCL